MKGRAIGRKTSITHYTFDQLYKGVTPHTQCRCGHPAHEHLVTFRRTARNSIKCLANCPCKTFLDKWSGGVPS